MNEEENFSGQYFGDLKKQLEELLNLTKNGTINNNLTKLEKTLSLLKERLDVCGHCDGPTYKNGVCTEHFDEY